MKEEILNRQKNSDWGVTSRELVYRYLPYLPLILFPLR